VKNPWLSLWLRAANSAAGAARGVWAAEIRRQQRALVRKAGGSPAEDRSAASKKRATPKRRSGTGR
jgi:hypothetical protein